MLIDSLRLIGYTGPVGEVDHVIHFLLGKLDPQACKQVCVGCWPIIEAQRDGRQFRLAATRVFLEWKEKGRLKSTVRKGIMDERWGHGRVLGEFVYELVSMVMRRECSGVACGSLEELQKETTLLISQISGVKEETENFLHEHPTIEPTPLCSDYEQLEALNSALFDPIVLTNPKPAQIITDKKFDEHTRQLQSCLSTVPIIPDPRDLMLRASSLHTTLIAKHNQLATLHSQLDHQMTTILPKANADSDWCIENESINLII